MMAAQSTWDSEGKAAAHEAADVKGQSASFRLDGKPVQPLEISGAHGNRIHKLDAAEVDKFFGFAATEFGNYADSATLLKIGDPAELRAGFQ